MARIAFEVTYRGPALTDGDMPVRELAPALLALGELFTEASQQVHPDREPVALNIRATREGSFSIEVFLESKRAFDQFVDMFSGDAATAVANLFQIVGGTYGLLWFLKTLAKRKILRSDPSPRQGSIRITLEDGTTIDVPSETLRLYSSINARRNARTVVEPLGREGVKELRISKDETVTVSIGDQDLPAFELGGSEPESLLEQDLEMVVEISSWAASCDARWAFACPPRRARSAPPMRPSATNRRATCRRRSRSSGVRFTPSAYSR